MARTLNPNLFGPIDTPVVQVDAGHSQTNKRLREVEVQMEAVNQKIDKWAQMLEGKIQHLHNSQKVLGDQIKQVAAGFSEQNANILSRLNERRAFEAKTQDIIDRHNQVVTSFEQKVQHIQKIATEQEMKIIAYQATYDEILKEIRRIRTN